MRVRVCPGVYKGTRIGLRQREHFRQQTGIEIDGGTERPLTETSGWNQSLGLGMKFLSSGLRNHPPVTPAKFSPLNTKPLLGYSLSLSVSLG